MWILTEVKELAKVAPSFVPEVEVTTRGHLSSEISEILSKQTWWRVTEEETQY